MKSEDHRDPHPLPLPLRYRTNQRGLFALAADKFSRPSGIFVLVVLSYFLGYLSYSHFGLAQPARDLWDHNHYYGQCADPIPSSDVRQTIINRVFNGTSPWENFPPDHVKDLLFPEWKKGWGSQGAVFENLIRRVRPKTIVEVGTFLGASATHMVGLTKGMGLDTQIICVDDFRGWPGYYDGGKSLRVVNGDSLLMYQFMKNVVNVNATESIMLMPFSATTALGGLCDWGVYGDLVEVDAAHDFHSAWVDINNAYKVLRPGGVIFGHDYFLEVDEYGVRRAAELFARLHGFKIEVDGEHWIMT